MWRSLNHAPSMLLRTRAMSVPGWNSTRTAGSFTSALQAQWWAEYGGGCESKEKGGKKPSPSNGRCGVCEEHDSMSWQGENNISTGIRAQLKL